MGRPKGTVNKKNNSIELSIDDNNEFQKNTEDFMKENEELEQIQQELDLARVELEKTKVEIENKKHELKSIPSSAKLADAPAMSIKNNSLNEKIAAQKARDNEMVTGKFHNLRAKGQPAKLTYMRYADDPVKWYTFQHGEVYSIPRGFADEINDHYHTPHFIKNEGIITDPSNPESGIHAVDRSDKMYSFTPINF